MLKQAKVGSKVQGTYHGQVFSGTIRAIEPDFTARGTCHLFVDLDAPIPTPSAARRTSLFLGSVNIRSGRGAFFQVEVLS